MKACFMGLGYIGLPTAIIAAKHGIQITGVDINPHVVKMTNAGHLHIIVESNDAPGGNVTGSSESWHVEGFGYTGSQRCILHGGPNPVQGKPRAGCELRGSGYTCRIAVTERRGSLCNRIHFTCRNYRGYGTHHFW